MASATARPTVVIDARTRMEIVVAVMLGLFLAALDQTVVGTALPRIVTDLHGNDIYSWTFTAYLLTATISGPITRIDPRTLSHSRACSAVPAERSRDTVRSSMPNATKSPSAPTMCRKRTIE